MKTLKALLAVMLVTLCLCGCQNETKQPQEPEIPTPFTEEETMEAALEKTGLEFSIPYNFKPTVFLAYENGMVHLEQVNEDESKIYLRKAPVNPEMEDISGDYNSYEKTDKVTLVGQNVTVRMNGNKVHVATWTDGDYSYAVGTTAGMSIDELIDFVEQIK